MGKTILWIDDFDNRISHVRRRNENKITHGDDLRIFAPEYIKQVVIKKRFYDALNYIFESYGEFDCVILDIDMNHNFGTINREDRVWKKFFNCISIEEKLEEDEKGKKAGYIQGKTTEEELSRNAGFYLMILLLTLGFPKERIIMFSAFGEEDQRVSGWEKKFCEASLYPPKLVDKGVDWQARVHEALNARLGQMYDYEEQGYYFLRKLIFEVYALVEESYGEEGDDAGEILFNQMVREKDKRLGKERVKELFDSLVGAFSVYRPVHKNISLFLYRSMKQFSEPFEADFSPQYSDSQYRVVKLFRNWSSHSKFGENQLMKQEDFMLLFLIESSLFLSRNHGSAEAFKKILQTINSRQEDMDRIGEKIYRAAWDICSAENEKQERLKELYTPYNMADVLHKLGNKKTSEYPMKYEYLWMVFICSCFEKKIIHNKDKSISVKYFRKKELSEINRILIQYAYTAWQNA